MRDVIFKDHTSAASRKKDVILREVFEKDGVLARSERRCFYFIKDVTRVESPEVLKTWLELRGVENGSEKRHFHIMKTHNDELCEDSLICKIRGTFYAVANNRVFTIAFMHYFKVHFAKVSLAK